MEIEEYLTYIARQQRANATEQFAYYGMEDFLLKEGRGFSPAPLPARLKIGKKKECFRNASLVVVEHPDLVYCEGLAISDILPFPIHHAWVADRHFAYDVTWEPAGVEYFGVAFDDDFLFKTLMAREFYGLLEMNGKLYKEGLPSDAKIGGSDAKIGG